MVRLHARPRVRIQSTIYINLESGEFPRRKRTRRASRPVTHLLLIIRNDREEPMSSTALSRGDQLVRSLRVRSPSHAFFLTCAKREGTIPRYGDVALSRRSKHPVLTDHFRIRTVLPPWQSKHWRPSSSRGLLCLSGCVYHCPATSPPDHAVPLSVSPPHAPRGS